LDNVEKLSFEASQKKVESLDKGVSFLLGRFSGSTHGGFGLGTQQNSRAMRYVTT
jgi:hypothetical protein